MEENLAHLSAHFFSALTTPSVKTRGESGACFIVWDLPGPSRAPFIPTWAGLILPRTLGKPETLLCLFLVANSALPSVHLCTLGGPRPQRVMSCSLCLRGQKTHFTETSYVSSRLSILFKPHLYSLYFFPLKKKKRTTTLWGKRREKDRGAQSTKPQHTQAYFGNWKHLYFLSSLKGNKKLPSGIKFEEKLPKGGMDVNHASIPHYGLTFEVLSSLLFLSDSQCV